MVGGGVVAGGEVVVGAAVVGGCVVVGGEIIGGGASLDLLKQYIVPSSPTMYNSSLTIAGEEDIVVFILHFQIKFPESAAKQNMSPLSEHT